MHAGLLLAAGLRLTRRASKKNEIRHYQEAITVESRGKSAVRLAKP